MPGAATKCEYRLNPGLNMADMGQVKRMLQSLLPPGKTHDIRAGKTVELRVSVALLERWDRLSSYGTFSCTKQALKNALAGRAAAVADGPGKRPKKPSKAAAVKVAAPRNEALVAELQSLVGRRPIGLYQEEPAGEVVTVYWLGLRPYGSAYMLVPHVLSAGYTQERADEVARALHEGQLYPFFLCDRLLVILHQLRQHVVAVRRTAFVMPSSAPLPGQLSVA